MHKHGKRFSSASAIVPSSKAKRASIEFPDKTVAVSNLPEHALQYLSEGARHAALNCGLSLTDCAGATVADISAILGIDPETARTFLAITRAPAAKAINEVVQANLHPREVQVTPPPIPFKKSWLRLSIGSKPSCLQLALPNATMRKTRPRGGSTCWIPFTRSLKPWEQLHKNTVQR